MSCTILLCYGNLHVCLQYIIPSTTELRHNNRKETIANGKTLTYIYIYIYIYISLLGLDGNTENYWMRVWIHVGTIATICYITFITQVISFY